MIKIAIIAVFITIAIGAIVGKIEFQSMQECLSEGNSETACKQTLNQR